MSKLEMKTVTCGVCDGEGKAGWESFLCQTCRGSGRVDARRYSRWFGDIIGGDPLRTLTSACPLDLAVEHSFVAAMNHWLDNLPDSPQGATLAGRMAKLKHRLTWGDDSWIIRQNDGSFSEIENSTLIGLVDHPRTLIAGGAFALSVFRRRNGKWHWDAHDGTDMLRAGDCDDEYEAMRAAESSLGLPVFPYDRSGPRDPTKRIKGRLVSYRLPEGE